MSFPSPSEAFLHEGFAKQQVLVLHVPNRTARNCLFTTATILALPLLLLSMWLREFLTTLPLALTRPLRPWMVSAQHCPRPCHPSYCSLLLVVALLPVLSWSSFSTLRGLRLFGSGRAKDSRLPRYGWAPAAALLSLRLAHTPPHAIPLQCPGSFLGVLCLRWRGYHQSTAGPRMPAPLS